MKNTKALYTNNLCAIVIWRFAPFSTLLEYKILAISSYELTRKTQGQSLMHAQTPPKTIALILSAPQIRALSMHFPPVQRIIQTIFALIYLRLETVFTQSITTVRNLSKYNPYCLPWNLAISENTIRINPLAFPSIVEADLTLAARGLLGTGVLSQIIRKATNQYLLYSISSGTELHMPKRRKQMIFSFEISGLNSKICFQICIG